MLAALSFLAGAVTILLVWGIASLIAAGSRPIDAGANPTSSPGRTESPVETPEPSDEEQPSATIPATPGTDSQASPVDCSSSTVEVRSADELSSALADAEPGDVIEMAPGTYVGEFVATVSGTDDDPITLCGPADAVLDGGDWKGDYVFHLDGARYWHLKGFSVTNGQKGVMADGTVGSTIEGLTVFHIGDEAIHLRKHSTDNLIVGNDVSDTGLRREKFGEGIYIGTAESNWETITGGEPDNSDRNVIQDNHIHGTTSEAIDIKEGTTGGIVRGNTFDGAAIVGADSWVDVKGNGWVIEDNRGVNSPLDGFQTHEIGNGGWGTGNVFRGNTADVNGPGFGFSLTPERDNVVACDNKVSEAGEGYSNVDCR
ncbi:hypothetical protein OB08_00910 [Microbacterium sp. HJ5]